MDGPAAGPSGLGTVVMDVGGDIGALILYTPAAIDGREIEISRDGQRFTSPDAPRPRGASGGPQQGPADRAGSGWRCSARTSAAAIAGRELWVVKLDFHHVLGR